MHGCPEPIVSRADGHGPEHEALLADSVGLALLVVLETLDPAERLAFVLHDMFARAVRRDRADRRALARGGTATREPRAPALRGARPAPDADVARQREVIDAFLAAARDGDFEALLAVLDPDVVLRVDRGALRPSLEVRGAAAVIGQALTFSRLASPFGARCRQRRRRPDRRSGRPVRSIAASRSSAEGSSRSTSSPTRSVSGSLSNDRCA